MKREPGNGKRMQKENVKVKKEDIERKKRREIK
jgi:hypothetical protein